MHQFVINTLGTFQVLRHNRPITRFDSDKARALLVYLAVEKDRPHRRDTLTTLLWPDLAETDARNNLRKTLNRLRQAIGDQQAVPPLLCITRQSMQLNPQSDMCLDVHAFRTAIAHTRTYLQPDISALIAAINLYRGDFLAHSYLSNSLEFETWMLAQRASLQTILQTALQRLVFQLLQQHDYDQAQYYAQQLVATDPLEDKYHRILMQVLHQSGQRSAALRQYTLCRELLWEELGVEPDVETVTLYEQIHARRAVRLNR